MKKLAGRRGTCLPWKTHSLGKTGEALKHLGQFFQKKQLMSVICDKLERQGWLTKKSRPGEGPCGARLATEWPRVMGGPGVRGGPSTIHQQQLLRDDVSPVLLPRGRVVEHPQRDAAACGYLHRRGHPPVILSSYLPPPAQGSF